MPIVAVPEVVELQELRGMCRPGRARRAAPARAGLLAAAASLAFAGTARAEELPGGVTEQLGATLPPGLVFRESTGRTLTLGEAVRGELPTVLVLSSYECPMLCGLILRGLAGSLVASGLRPGRDVRLLTVSFDLRDTPESAARKQASALEAVPGSRPTDWPFLVGEARSVDALTAAVGFRVAYLPEAKQYAHPAALVVLTPDGRISRYLYGIDYPTRDLRLAVAEAGAGRQGPSFDRILLTCFAYDPVTRRYAVGPAELVRLGSALLALLATAVALRACWCELGPLARASEESSDAG